MKIQNYEEYWKFTNAFTDYNGTKFIKSLRICINFIDTFKDEEYSPNKYNNLQLKIKNELNIDFISIRKAINQLVKLGFINSYLLSYQKESIDYLNAKTNRRRQSILSKIVYSYSSFNRSINNDSNLHQINFLIDTLIEIGKLSIADIIALMLVDINIYTKGYLNRDELNEYISKMESINFIARKYNQISYLTNLLKKLDDIIFVNNELYFTEDAKQIFGENIEVTTRIRNPYLHLIYKNQLRDESFSVFEDEKCMVEKVFYPVLIASHIKPFAKSSDEEAYDPNNGILLSKNIDSLFDLGYITFEDDGSIIFSNTIKMKKDLIDKIKSYSLDAKFINKERIMYLNYHRNFVFEQRYKQC